MFSGVVLAARQDWPGCAAIALASPTAISSCQKGGGSRGNGLLQGKARPGSGAGWKGVGEPRISTSASRAAGRRTPGRPFSNTLRPRARPRAAQGASARARASACRAARRSARHCADAGPPPLPPFCGVSCTRPLNEIYSRSALLIFCQGLADRYRFPTAVFSPPLCFPLAVVYPSLVFLGARRLREPWRA